MKTSDLNESHSISKSTHIVSMTKCIHILVRSPSGSRSILLKLYYHCLQRNGKLLTNIIK